MYISFTASHIYCTTTSTASSPGSLASSHNLWPLNSHSQVLQVRVQRSWIVWGGLRAWGQGYYFKIFFIYTAPWQGSANPREEPGFTVHAATGMAKCCLKLLKYIPTAAYSRNLAVISLYILSVMLVSLSYVNLFLILNSIHHLTAFGPSQTGWAISHACTFL